MILCNLYILFIIVVHCGNFTFGVKFSIYLHTTSGLSRDLLWNNNMFTKLIMHGTFNFNAFYLNTVT